MKFESPEHATPLSDESDLLLPWVKDMSDLNRAEAENIVDAKLKYLKKDRKPVESWFHPAWLQKVHKLMFGKVWKWAGRYRKTNTSIGIAPELIPSQLASFCHEVAAWSSEPVELTFVERSSRIHHRLVQIHPFENGNGRFARFVGDRYLLCCDCAYPKWPSALHSSNLDRKAYMEALQSADRGNYDLLLRFMISLGASDPHPEQYLHVDNPKIQALLRALMSLKQRL